jgi:hypothetical protein
MRVSRTAGSGEPATTWSTRGVIVSPVSRAGHKLISGPVWDGHLTAHSERSRGGQHLILNSRGCERIDAGVTPSVACGLGRAPVSAKGWVLAMLARSRAARGSGPATPGWSSPALAWLRQRQRRVRSAPRLSLRPSCLAQENRTRGGGRRHRASITSGQ